MSANEGLRSERGYALAVVVVFTTVLLVGLTEATINWQKAMQREREEELIFRGKQFIRAIELWQRKFPGTYPTTIDALLNTNNFRFLRKKWKDPITNSTEWRLIKLNPDGSVSGLTLTASGGLPGLTLAGAQGQQPAEPSRSSSSGQPIGRQGSSSLGSQTGPQSTGASRSTQGQRTTSQSFGASVFGGIVGVASTSEKESLKIYNGRNKYNEWEFYYIPRQQGPTAGVPGPQPGQTAKPATSPLPGGPSAVPQTPVPQTPTLLQRNP